MRRALCVVCVVALAAVTSSAAFADRTQPARGRVLALGLSSAEVVFASGATKTDGCPTLTIWHTDLRFDTRFGTGRYCPATSTGRGIAAVAVAQDRVLWLSYAGGNNRDWSLWTATERARTPRLLRFVTVDVDAPAPIVVGGAYETLLPYAVGRTVIALGPNGARSLTWTAPSRVLALAAGPTDLKGRVGVVALLEDGSVATLSPSGALLRTYAYGPGDVLGISVGATGTLVQLDGSLEIRKGTARRTFPLPAGASQLDYSSGFVVYAADGSIHALRISDGVDRIVATPLVQPFLVEFSRRGLSWAAGSCVSFRAWLTFIGRFAS